MLTTTSNPERRATVERARETWIKKLIDLSRRNNLLFYRPLKRGTLDLTTARADALQELLDGSSVGLERLHPDGDLNRLTTQAVEISRRALANREERNLETLFLAFGLATWKSDDGGRPPEAPVVLLPVAVEKRARNTRIALRTTGNLQANPVLLHVLQSIHRCAIDEDTLLSAANGNGEDAGMDLDAVYRALATAAASVPEFLVKPSIVLGNFSFHKMAMVRDLTECGDVMVDHDVIAGLAGDAGARSDLGQRGGLPDARELDEVHPDVEFLILDADSSQQRVVAAALKDRDGVIHGPPGTGKSQTIANLIAALAASGKRVLFVAQKRAALEVVLKRLQQADLGHLALDLHGAELTRREVMAKIADSLEHVRDATPVDTDGLHSRLHQCRTKLNDHVARLHQRRQPSDLSAFELQGRLLALGGIATRTRWRGPELQRLDAELAGRIRSRLEEAVEVGDLVLGTSASPWNDVKLINGHAALEAHDLVTKLGRDQLPHLRTKIEKLCRDTGLGVPNTLEGCTTTVKLVEEVNSTLSRFRPEIFDHAEALAQALDSAASWIGEAWAWLTNSAFRGARKRALSLRTAGKTTATRLRAEVHEVCDQLQRWRETARVNSKPCAGGVAEARELLSRTVSSVESLAQTLDRRDLASLALDDLDRLVSSLANDANTPAKLPRALAFRTELESLGFRSLLDELKDAPLAATAWTERFDHAWLSSCLDQVRAEDATLASFNGRTHDATADEFQRLDRKRLEISAARVRRAHAERAVEAMNAFPSQSQLVRSEASKKKRHMPLRKLVEQAPDVLTALRPCWMVSPLSVAELLPASRHFDLVLFDEASQVLPEDAVCALMRGRRTIVAGDQRQLPPTTFFAGEAEDDEKEDEQPGLNVSGYESILDSMCTFLEPWQLEWHYRSRDEALIAFSNRYIYGDRLITFPGTGGPSAVEHVLVEQSGLRDGEEESVGAEVRRVVDLVIKHARSRPSETLGVITMGIPHQRRIQAALDAATEADPELAAFLDEQREERFFVKNLERVQGDERDAIILSIGYGKDRNGKLPYRFGPLLYEGGERRLNVAVTRARRRMTLVSSFSHVDMDPGRSSATGVELLRRYLEFAASAGRSLGDRGVSGGLPLNPFEVSVYDALTAKGIPLLAQWGASRYRIDLVAQHPDELGRFVLAIECDGASYHSAPTARDRDRLRQQQLEALGWRFHRIWSTDWFLSREQEIDRALRAYEKAVALSKHDPEPVVNVRPVPPGPAAPSNARPPRPAIPRRRSIEEYSEEELAAFVHWVQSDGRLLTDDEIVRSVMVELGFQRRGARIEAAIRRGIERTRGPCQ
ncbi:MAG: AAA domain-containing protein [Thermodesulfobacteriota bacterium]